SQFSQGSVVQVDRAKPRRARSRHVGGGLKNVKLGSKASAQVTLRDFERFIGVLDVARFRLQNAIRLLKIEESAAHIGRDGELRCFQCKNGGVASCPRRLHPALRRMAIEDM